MISIFSCFKKKTFMNIDNSRDIWGLANVSGTFISNLEKKVQNENQVTI